VWKLRCQECKMAETVIYSETLPTDITSNWWNVDGGEWCPNCAMVLGKPTNIAQVMQKTREDAKAKKRRGKRT